MATATAPQKIVTVVGARPQFIKAAAVSRALRAHGGLEEVLVHTGQHHDADMSDVFFAELEITRPKRFLGIHGGGHGDMTGRMLAALEAALIEEQPALVLIYGDTNSTLAGALAAAKLNIPVAHVEAGLRSFNRRMPEEINRVVADHLSALLFCPTEESVKNLAREGVAAGVHQVGDVMYDCALHARAHAMASSRILEELGLEEGGFALATVHRAENTDTPEALAAVMDYLEARARELPVVLPLHPRTREALARYGIAPRDVVVTAPVGYHDINRLLAAAAEVLTDSGGLQKEAYFHRVPCVTLRGETEWVETVTHGWNRLWQGPNYVMPRQEIADYGDGHAAERIVEIVADFIAAR